MKKFLIILMLCLSLTIVISYGVSTVFISPYLKENTIYTATTVSQNKIIQQRLKNWGYYTGAVDGILGPKSIAAIKKFQKANGLVADGIVGPKTAAKLRRMNSEFDSRAI